MPYLKSTDRKQLEYVETQIAMTDIDTPGKLNYLITLLLIRAVKGKTVNYTLLNGIYGAVMLAGKEFWLRVIEPYERKKQEENDDVYPEELTQ